MSLPTSQEQAEHMSRHNNVNLLELHFPMQYAQINRQARRLEGHDLFYLTGLLLWSLESVGALYMYYTKVH